MKEIFPKPIRARSQPFFALALAALAAVSFFSNGYSQPKSKPAQVQKASQLEKNKELVKNLLNTAFNLKDVKAAAEMVTERYIQHNPQVPTGKSGFLQAIPGFYKMFPDLKWELKHIWAEGDFVIVHSHYQFAKEGNGSAVVDIFRIKDGKADEHWDVMQEIPDKMAHNNGMF